MNNNSNNKVLVVIIILLLAIFGLYIYANKTNQNSAPNDQVSTTTPATTTTLTMMFVKVALLGAQLETSNKKDFRGCDVVILQNKEVPYTTTPLNSALKELFRTTDFWNPGDLAPSNFIASQKDLLFDKAILENGVAKIYLVGKQGPFNGVCDDPRASIQLTETALQFPTVKAVEFYLNNKKTTLVPSEK